MKFWVSFWKWQGVGVQCLVHWHNNIIIHWSIAEISMEIWYLSVLKVNAKMLPRNISVNLEKQKKTFQLCLISFSLVTYLQDTWIFGAELCHFWIFCDFLCCCASIYCLLFVAINRFMAISHPLDFVWREMKVNF